MHHEQPPGLLIAADESHKSRRARLYRVIERFAARRQKGFDLLRLRELLVWLLNTGELTKTNVELGRCPDGLCCHPSSVKRLVAVAVRHRLVSATENYYVSEGQRSNTLALDWQGIAAFLGERPVGQIELGSVQIELGSVQNGPPIKEYSPSCPLLKDSGTGTGAGPPPRLFFEEQIPELAEARSRTIDPLPAGELLYGVFSRGWLKAQTLTSAPALIEWHRRQLSAPAPVAGNSEADLLLTLAAAKYAKSLPAAEVRQSYVAVWIDVVSRKQWRKVLPWIPEVRKLLDRGLERCGDELLHGARWPPAALAKQPTTNQPLGAKHGTDATAFGDAQGP